MASPIFISYSSTDRQIADKIRDLLVANGHDCFMAPYGIEPGDIWSDKLAAAIDRASMVVLIFSERCNRSDHIKSELAMARTRGLPIIPYRIEDVLPRSGMEYFTAISHWLDDFQPPAPPSSDLLLKAVRRFSEPNAGLPPSGPVTPRQLAGGDRQRLLERLGDEILEQCQPIVAVDGWNTDEQADLWSLLQEKVLRNEPSPQNPAKRYVGFVRDDECLSVLAAAVKRQAIHRPEVWLQRTERFPVLADALGLWLAGENESSLPAAFALQRHSALPRVLRGYLVQLAHEGARVAALQKLLTGSTADAIRGFIQATQEIASSSAGLDSADALLDVIGRELERRARGDEAAANEARRLSIEIANQGGRFHRRKGDLQAAIRVLRAAVELAKDLKEERLLGICITNLCRAELDAGLAGEPIDRDAIIRTLTENVARLKRCGDKPNLAVAWNNLGDAYAPVNPAEAEKCLRKDLQLAEELNEVESLVDALNRLGAHLSGQERLREAVEIHRRERELLSRLCDPEREAKCLANLGRAHLGLAIRDPEAREAAVQDAIQILSDSRRRYGNLKRPEPLGAVLENLGKCHWIMGDTSLAVATLRDAIREFQRWPQHAADARRLQDDLSRAGF